MPKKKEDGSLADLVKRHDQAKELAGQIRGLFADAKGLPKDDRRRSQGRLGVDEAAALRSLVDAMDLEPGIFGVLADEDEGDDPKKLETSLLRERFDRWELYASLAAELEQLASILSDAALATGALVKPVTLAAYEIAKPLSKRHPGIREKIAPALDYYAANAAASAAARRAKSPDAKEADG